MVRLIRDFYSLNRARIRRDFLRIYFAFLVMECGLFLQSLPMQQVMSEHSMGYILLFIVTAISMTLVIAAFLLFLFCFIAGYFTLLRLAKRAGLSVTKYMDSEMYPDEITAEFKL